MVVLCATLFLCFLLYHLILKQSKKAIRIKHSSVSSNEIPVLSDDLMLMIFDELTTEERIPLGLTCKRLRELDFECGNKKFDKISFQWDSETHSIIGETLLPGIYISPNQKWKQAAQDLIDSVKDPQEQLIVHRLHGDSSNPIQSTRHHIRLFRRSETESLMFIHNSKNCDQVDLSLIESLLKTVTCDHLDIVFRCYGDCGEKLIPMFVNRRNVDREDSTVVINGFYRHSPQNILRSRAMMMKLSRIGELMIGFDKVPDGLVNQKVIKDECLIDDAVLLHITAQVNDATLGIAVCTARGILDALELIAQCTYSTNPKYVRIYVSKAVIDEVFQTADARFTRYMLYDKYRCMRDSQSEATVVVSGDRPDCPPEKTLDITLTNNVYWGTGRMARSRLNALNLFSSFSSYYELLNMYSPSALSKTIHSLSN